MLIFEYGFVTLKMGPHDVLESLENVILFDWLETRNTFVECLHQEIHTSYSV